MINSRFDRGFTLIELLFVISIISLLSSFIIGPTRQAQAKARDVERKQNLVQTRNALELYRTDHGRYPVSSVSGNAAEATWLGVQAGTGCQAVGTNDWIPGLVAGDYIDQLPVDRQVGNIAGCAGYQYWSDGTDYKLISYRTVETSTTEPADPLAVMPEICDGTATIDITNSYGYYTNGAQCVVPPPLEETVDDGIDDGTEDDGTDDDNDDGDDGQDDIPPVDPYPSWSNRLDPTDTQRAHTLFDLEQALALFKSEHGYYPISTPISGRRRGAGTPPPVFLGPKNYSSHDCQYATDWIPGLTPTYISSLPDDPVKNDTPGCAGYYYWSDGTDYKLAIFQTTVDPIAPAGDPLQVVADSCPAASMVTRETSLQHSFARSTAGAECKLPLVLTVSTP